jgi:transposase-like protein
MQEDVKSKKCFSLQDIIMNETGHGEHAIVDWSNYMRESCCVYMNKFGDMGKIGGEGVIVEIDESKFGKRKYHTGHRVEGSWVFGGREREDKRKCFFEVVEKRDKETLLEIIKRKIVKGSIIISDCWKAYDCLESEGYRHLTVNHSENFKDPETGAHTNSIEGTWQKIKHGVHFPKFGIKSGFLGGYLAEYHWRCFVGDSGDRYMKFLECIREVFNGKCAKKECNFCLVEENKEGGAVEVS